MSLIPILTIYNDFGALFGVAAKSYPGVWMAHTGFGLASTTFLLRNFLKSLPNEMMEAAKVDGASHYDIFLRIIIPLSIPAFASILIAGGNLPIGSVGYFCLDKIVWEPGMTRVPPFTSFKSSMI